MRAWSASDEWPAVDPFATPALHEQCLVPGACGTWLLLVAMCVLCAHWARMSTAVTRFAPAVDALNPGTQPNKKPRQGLVCSDCALAARHTSNGNCSQPRQVLAHWVGATPVHTFRLRALMFVVHA